jgi:hypothetical protein
VGESASPKVSAIYKNHIFALAGKRKRMQFKKGNFGRESGNYLSRQNT